MLLLFFIVGWVHYVSSAKLLGGGVSDGTKLYDVIPPVNISNGNNPITPYMKTRTTFTVSKVTHTKSVSRRNESKISQSGPKFERLALAPQNCSDFQELSQTKSQRNRGGQQKVIRMRRKLSNKSNKGRNRKDINNTLVELTKSRMVMLPIQILDLNETSNSVTREEANVQTVGNTEKSQRSLEEATKLTTNNDKEHVENTSSLILESIPLFPDNSTGDNLELNNYTVTQIEMIRENERISSKNTETKNYNIVSVDESRNYNLEGDENDKQHPENETTELDNQNVEVDENSTLHPENKTTEPGYQNVEEDENSTLHPQNETTEPDNQNVEEDENSTLHPENKTTEPDNQNVESVEAESTATMKKKLSMDENPKSEIEMGKESKILISRNEYLEENVVNVYDSKLQQTTERAMTTYSASPKILQPVTFTAREYNVENSEKYGEYKVENIGIYSEYREEHDNSVQTSNSLVNQKPGETYLDSVSVDEQSSSDKNPDISFVPVKGYGEDIISSSWFASVDRNKEPVTEERTKVLNDSFSDDFDNITVDDAAPSGNAKDWITEIGVYTAAGVVAVLIFLIIFLVGAVLVRKRRGFPIFAQRFGKSTSYKQGVYLIPSRGDRLTHGSSWQDFVSEVGSDGLSNMDDTFLETLDTDDWN